jgi:hypothetical protein
VRNGYRTGHADVSCDYFIINAFKRGVGFSFVSCSSVCYRQVSLLRYCFPWKVSSRKSTGGTKTCNFVSFRSLFAITNIQTVVSDEIAFVKHFNIVVSHRGTST